MGLIRPNLGCNRCPHRTGACVLSVLNEQAFSEVSAAFRYIFFPNGSTLFHAEAPIAGSYFLCQGKVKLYAHDADGRTVLLRLCRPGELFVIPVRDTHTVSAKAVGDVIVGILSGKQLFRMFTQHPILALAVILQQNDDLTGYQTRVLDLATKPVRERLLCLLQELGVKHGVRQANGAVMIDVDLSSQDLAAMVGASRQTVSLEFSWLRKKGLIAYTRRRITILDLQELAKLAPPR